MISVVAPPKGVEVVHSVAGRVRLRTANAEDNVIKVLAQQLRQVQGVLAVRTNKTTGSLLIIFDQDQLSHSQLLTVLQYCGTSRTFTKQSHRATVSAKVTYSFLQMLPGRVRFRVPRIACDAEYAQRLKALLLADAQIIGVCMKRAAASVTIRYIPSSAEDNIPSLIVKLIQLADDQVASIPAQALSTGEVTSEQTSPWSGMKLPALATLLSLLGGPLGFSVLPLLVRGVIAIAALPVVRRAWESISEERQLNSDFLDLMAIVMITAQGHFLTSSGMIALIELGEAIREQTARSSRSRTLDLLSSLGQFVWVERNGQKQQIPIEQVQPEDTIIVYPGEQIPVDGHILGGRAVIDEQKLTGESMPVVRTTGQAVYASTLVREGQLYILAERIGAATRAGRTIELIQAAPVHDTRIENYAAKIADRAVVPTILLGGVVFAITRSAARAASVLTIDFATGIRVSVPTTVMAAMLQATRRGVLIRSGRAIEKLAQVDAIVFDKTGTLTQGNVSIVSLKTAEPSIPQLRLLELAAAAEQRITHPVAEAVTRYALSQEVQILPRGEWDYQVGLGIRAQIDGQSVLVGSDRFLRQEGISLESFLENHPELKTLEYPTIYVASNGELQGALQYTDPLRPESRAVITTLRKALGAQIHLLTGDNQQRANTVARELGIEPTQIHAEAFPEDKAEIVQRLHNQGRTVAFVGDGLNDSAALAYADVSISFRDGSEIARETADVVLMNNNLCGLVEAIAIARDAKRIIDQNTGVVAVPNLSGLILAATVGLNPMAATLINNGSSVVAGVNGLRPMLKGRSTMDEFAGADFCQLACLG
ncbi:heavy metal translocating P-type ATPase [Lyngbya aestuarii]|uniref:heavy metal translocating P-type ATPase n=1 Tax=Lyngbya aestuarii TaxID=118322 RepID=UPI00403DAC6D